MSEHTQQRAVSRRAFLKGAAVTAGSIAISPLLQACAPSAPSAAPATATPEPTVMAAVAPEAMKLTIWEHDKWKVGLDTEWINKYIEQFNPSLTFEMTLVPFDEQWKKLQAAIPTKTAPDMFMFHTNQYSLFVDNGLLLPLPEDLFPPAWIEDTFISAKCGYGRDGKPYVLAPGYMTNALIYNKKMWEKKGLGDKDAPKTWAALVDIAKELTVRDPNGNIQVAGYSPVGVIGDTYHFLDYQQGYWYYSEDGQKVYWNTAQSQQTMQWYKDLWEVHKVTTHDFLTFTEAFGTEKAAIVSWYGWGEGFLTTNYPDLEWGVFPCPTWTGDYKPAVGPSFDNPSSLVVPISTPRDRAQECFKIISWLYHQDDYVVEFAAQAGSAPTKLSLLEHPRVKNDPFLSVVGQYLEYTIVRVAVPSVIFDVERKWWDDGLAKTNGNVKDTLRGWQAEGDETLQATEYHINERVYKHPDLLKFHTDKDLLG
jgi:multiple sugar transport system substrate-binding protein